MNASVTNTFLLMDGTVNLTGGGRIEMSNDTQNFIQGLSGGPADQLVNVNNTIEGSGNIGNNTMSAVNAFQKANGLASGQLTMETLRRLKVI